MTEEPKTYPYIRVWGRYLHSSGYYVEAQIQEAQADNAPADAVYKSSRTGQWVTVDNLVGQDKRNVKRVKEEMGI